MIREYKFLTGSFHFHMVQVLQVCASRMNDTSKNKKLNMMVNFNEVTRENNLQWSQIPYHPYRILIGASG